MQYRKTSLTIRAEYEDLRDTAAFKRWRGRQLGRQWGRCFWCFAALRTRVTHVDHVFPLFHGGTNVFWNLVLACADCNLSKGAYLLTRRYEWMCRLRNVPLAVVWGIVTFTVLIVRRFITSK